MSSLAARPIAAHQALPEKAVTGRAKANLQLPESEPDMDLKPLIGRAIQRAVALVGWSNKEAAAKVGTNDSQFGKWISGAERPQFDRLFAVDELRQPLVIALAEIAGSDVETTVRIRRTV